MEDLIGNLFSRLSCFCCGNFVAIKEIIERIYFWNHFWGFIPFWEEDYLYFSTHLSRACTSLKSLDVESNITK